LILILGATLATLLLLRHDYKRLEQVMSGSSSGADATNAARQAVIGQLVDLRRRSQFGRYVDLAMVGAMPLNREALADKLRLCDHAIAFSPADYAVFKCAALHALDGQADLAMARWTRALASYPQRADEVTAELAALLGEHPELAPLLNARLAVSRPEQ
ncbi:MAG TPA: Wzy polymerase domain-containing protein, partial [Rhodocyclaceae bacterium]|nr:Wzy polymerase domain-containing protein [Rhodocyclaceae bacterium]